ncbi:hypothetical protein CO038_02305 [Candidatus Pacearchaeota archaeon CG_4_9_14_0_2_um_filter_39_13]|nr:hypothetical protein [Candidatus Pacearchaeota archaeon]OIO43927.1 MAG: hypothetical protein AUJ64_01355 [Candidatus Pacearchaeota archaeon CG1_02_39_14]PJC44778.1 MAG: hypothetical protein CO038_02305 [Candidatus Pacearchaeota archaeon CG_4_9_14_0_2_um_filter_39_13]
MDVIILHGCPGDEEKAMDPERRTYDKHWIPWTRKKLEGKGIKTETPHMPIPWKADYESWKKEFDKLDVNKDSILVGHSCGAAFLVRWLGDTGKKVKRLILVAPWKIPYGKGERLELKRKFYTYEVNPEIKNNVSDIIIFTADDEEEDGKKSARIFHKALGGQLIELKKHGHYCFEDMNTEAFPELLKEILKS